MELMIRRLVLAGCAAMLWCVAAHAQVIEFQANGQKYQTLTRSGVTIMFAALPTRLSAWAVVQVSVVNGSGGPYVIRPEDFTFVRADGGSIRAMAANSVIQELMHSSSRNDVIKLVSAYESSLYGAPNMRSTNGYEERRQAALLTGPARLRAAAAASAVALVQTKLAPGGSTDGAIFFPTVGKPLGPGHLVVQTNTDTFEFNPVP